MSATFGLSEGVRGGNRNPKINYMKKITILACTIGLAVSPFASAITYTYDFDNLPETQTEQNPLGNPTTTIAPGNLNYRNWTGPLQSVKFEGTGSSIGVFKGNDAGIAVLDGRDEPDFEDTGYFLSTGGGPNAFGKITFQFSTAVTGLKFLWGTPDLFNFVTLFNGEDVVVENFGFEDNPPADQKTPVLYSAFSSLVFDRIEFTSSGIAFEFDNVTIDAPEPTTRSVPDGGTTAMLLGLSLVGLFFAQRRLSARSI
jgi:VPDSG-CTERM motif